MLDMQEAIKFNKDKSRKPKLYYILSLSYKGMGKYFHALMWLDEIKNANEQQTKQINSLKKELNELDNEEN